MNYSQELNLESDLPPSFFARSRRGCRRGVPLVRRECGSLGKEFLRTFYACAAELTRNPLLYPLLRRQFRRRLLRRFLYALYFTIEAHEIVVLGLFHCARDPKGIQSALRDR